ncbi:hybrid sensor histidine kinase/response regulator transcription factor [Puia sp.]|uniref:hybrid sensor histidine kinase/response regulator transcription factor n=1 Tax=Puia sp. TaxID=2045100 RepID=UPI002F418A7D
MSSAARKAFFALFGYLLFFVIRPLNAFAQEKQAVRFTALTTREGLSQSSVNCVFRDSYGFLWLGTQDGLNKYDGYSFTVYRHDPAKPRSISDNQIKCIIEDDLHRLWIGTLGGGLCIYDRNKDAFLRLEDIGIHPGFTIEPAIQSLLQDSKGNIWVGTFRGLLLIRPQQKTIREFQPDAANPSALGSPTVQAVFEDHGGRIWVATNNGLDGYRPADDGFTHYFQGTEPSYPGTPAHPGSAPILAITGDRRGELILGTDGGGLTVFDPSTGLARVYLPGVNPAASVRVAADDAFSISSPSVRTLCPSPDGNIWVGTENGLDLFNPQKGTFDHHRHTLIGEGSLTNNTILSLLEDKTGILWVGTAQGGLNKFDRNLFYFDVYRSTADPGSLSGDQVTSFAQDGNGDIWVGTDGAGLNRWDSATGRFIHYYPQPGSSTHPAGAAILSLLAGRDRRSLWIGTYGNGLDRYDLLTRRFTHYPAGPGPHELGNPSIYALLEDRQGNLWMGTNGGGVDVLHADGSITRHRFTGDRDSVSNNYIRCLMEDRAGQIWIGTYSGGISVYDPATKKFTVYDNVEHHLSNQVVFSLCQDDKGRIWAGTMGGGLNLFDPWAKRFRVYNEAQGLSNNIVNRIIEDEKGFLWMSTNKGISRLNPATGEFRNFGMQNGLQNLEFLVGSGFRDSRGKIFFGGISGFNVFDPLQETHDTVAPRPRLTGFFLFNKPVQPGEPGSPLKGDINQQTELVLSHDQSDFSIAYTATGYTIPSDNRYAYMLEGFDKNWTMAGSDRRATYTNLPPGRYLFRVKAANNDGVWSRSDTVLPIVVRPPFWKTWWAYLAYTLAALALLYLVYRDITERERLKGRIRLEQLTAEKTRELNEMKLHFFTNVSHELRTPLSLITDPLRRLINGELDAAQTRKYSRLMFDNAQRLTRLVDQMLDWRKLETGHLLLDWRTLPIVVLTKNIAGLFDLHAAERGIQYSLSAPDGEMDVPLDTDKFEKIVFNLISNAFKYTPDGGSIEVVIRRGPSAGPPSAELHVRDTGIGIAAALRDKVFDIFYQVEGSRRYESASTGIGLALARQLAELHGGRLGVVSEEGAGSDFILSLPMQQKTTRQDPPASPDEEGAEGADEEVPLILLVEDNAPLRGYIRTELGAGYRTEVAADGTAGLEKALQRVPDLIISDVMMPGLNGLELCRAVKTDQRTSHIPVILLTARQSDAHQVEGYDAGADVYIPKPFNMEVVVACVNSLLDSRRRLREYYAAGHDAGRAAENGAEGAVAGAVGDDRVPAEWNWLDRQFLDRAASLADQHLADILFDVDGLAAGLKVSRRQLYRKLKALLGETPHDYIVGRRLTAAERLLLTGEYTVSEVAFKTGFADAANFTRSFSRRYGMPPSKYRKEAR